MFFINLYENLNSIDNALEKNVEFYDNSFVDNFIDELKSYLSITENLEQLEKTSDNNFFTLDRYEGNYAVCENRTTGEMYDIPKFLVDSHAKDGDILKLTNGKFEIDFKETEKQKEIVRDLINRINE